MEEKFAQEKVTEAYQSAKAKVEKFAADERVQVAKGKVADAAKVAREKAKALASSENIARAKERLISLKSKEGRAAAVAGFMGLSMGNRILSATVAMVVVLMMFKIVSCVGGAVFNCGGCGGNAFKTVSNDGFLLVFSANAKTSEGSAYVHDSIPYVSVLNVVGDGVLAVCRKGKGGFLSNDLFASAERLSAFIGQGEFNRVVHIKADRAGYSDGTAIRSGIYVRNGKYSYNSKGGMRTVESFTELTDKSQVEKVNRILADRQQEKSDQLLKQEGDSIEIDVPIKTFCGFRFGTTPSKSWNLTKEHVNTPYTHERGDSHYEFSGTLVKPFRKFKEVKLSYTWVKGVPEHLQSIELLTDSFDYNVVSEESVVNELENVKKMIEEKFGIKFSKAPAFDLEIAYEWSLHESGSNDYASLLQQVQLKLDRYRCLQLKVHCQAVEKCDIKLQAKNKKVVDVSAGDGADVL